MAYGATELVIDQKVSRGLAGGAGTDNAMDNHSCPLLHCATFSARSLMEGDRGVVHYKQQAVSASLSLLAGRITGSTKISEAVGRPSPVAL